MIFDSLFIHHHHHDIGRLLCQLGKDGRNQRDKGAITNIVVNVSKFILPKILKTKLKVNCSHPPGSRKVQSWWLSNVEVFQPWPTIGLLWAQVSKHHYLRLLRMIWKWKQSALIGGRHCGLAFITFNCISKYLLFVLIFDHILSNSFIFYYILLYFQQCMQGGARHCGLVGKEEWTTVDWSQLQGGESIWRNDLLPGMKKLKK